jgi:hypothetical protein
MSSTRKGCCANTNCEFGLSFLLCFAQFVSESLLSTGDETFAYETVKMVKVKGAQRARLLVRPLTNADLRFADRHLGIMRLVLLVAIILYIVGYVLIVQQAYLKVHTLRQRHPLVLTRFDSSSARGSRRRHQDVTAAAPGLSRYICQHVLHAVVHSSG